MRIWLVLLFVPLSGCIGGGPVAATVFTFDPIDRTDPTPVSGRPCTALLETLNERADAQARVHLQQSLEDRGYWIADDVMVDMAADSEASTVGAQAGTAADAEVTGTNNQEAGADEADLVKTDGQWTYVLRQGTVHILHSQDIGDVAPYATIDVGGWYGGQLLLEKRGADDDRLVVITRSDPAIAATSQTTSIVEHAGAMTRVAVYSLADRSAPELLEEVWVEGDNVGARLVDGTAYIVVHDREDSLGLTTWAWPDEEDLARRGLDWDTFHDMPDATQRAIRLDVAKEAVSDNRQILAGLTLRDHLPAVLREADGRLAPEPVDDAQCRRLLINPDDTGRSVSTIVAIDVGDEEAPSRLHQIIGGRPIVYGAPGALVLAAPSNDFWWFWAQPDLEEATNIHWFDLDGLDVTHRASGRIDGIVQDQFGIDVHAGQLRLATTTGTWGRWWQDDPEPMMNHVAVMVAQNGALVEVGRVGGIAPEERLWSARFTDDRAYLVTFEQIDPLWIIDLSDPTDPTILGELEIPGVSTYIHPIDDDTLLTIGYGPGTDGTGLDWSRIQVSLFDISDPTSPRRADVLDVSPAGGWSWSGAVQEHKAFTYWDRIGTLAVPVTTHHSYQAEDGRWARDHHVALRLIDVDTVTDSLSLRGEVDQDALLDADRWWGGIERSYFLGQPDTGPVSVYAISNAGITSHDLATLEEQSAVAFP